jgi:hypothetical protein
MHELKSWSHTAGHKKRSYLIKPLSQGFNPIRNKDPGSILRTETEITRVKGDSGSI